MSTMGPMYQPGEEHGYAEPPERQRTDDDMVTMVGPDGSKREVSREAAQHTELGLGLGFADVVDRMLPHQLRAELRAMADRVDDAYSQGKEVGRVNGSARLDRVQREADGLATENERLSGLLDEAQRELRRVQAIAGAVQELALSSETLIDPRVLHQTIHDAHHGDPCGSDVEASA